MGSDHDSSLISPPGASYGPLSPAPSRHRCGGGGSCGHGEARVDREGGSVRPVRRPGEGHRGGGVGRPGPARVGLDQLDPLEASRVLHHLAQREAQGNPPEVQRLLRWKEATCVSDLGGRVFFCQETQSLERIINCYEMLAYAMFAFE